MLLSNARVKCKCLLGRVPSRPLATALVPLPFNSLFSVAIQREEK